jgi:hypothetical protein
MFFIARGTQAALQEYRPKPQISGTYALHGSLEDRRDRFFSLSGTLDIDSLGDISGEASARRVDGRTAGAGSCDVIIDGSYKRTQDAQIIDGTIGIIPVYGHCGELGELGSWHLDIVRGPKPGNIDLFQRAQSAPWFVGLARPESAPFDSGFDVGQRENKSEARSATGFSDGG